jgi:hypothetical protein
MSTKPYVVLLYSRVGDKLATLASTYKLIISVNPWKILAYISYLVETISIYKQLMS